MYLGTVPLNINIRDLRPFNISIQDLRHLDFTRYLRLDPVERGRLCDLGNIKIATTGVVAFQNRVFHCILFFFMIYYGR